MNRFSIACATLFGLGSLLAGPGHAQEVKQDLWSVSREAKYKTKSFIDTLMYRAGDTAGAWVNTGLMALGLSAGGVALAAAPMAALGVWLALFLARRHTDAASANEVIGG